MARVLVVAEERVARRVAWVLETAGHDARLAYEPDGAIREAEVIRPEVVVINGVIPAAKRETFVEAVAKIAPGVAIVDMSHQAGADDLPVAAAEHLTQPFHADDLLGAIDRLTGR